MQLDAKDFFKTTTSTVPELARPQRQAYEPPRNDAREQVKTGDKKWDSVFDKGKTGWKPNTTARPPAPPAAAAAPAPPTPPTPVQAAKPVDQPPAAPADTQNQKSKSKKSQKAEANKVLREAKEKSQVKELAARAAFEELELSSSTIAAEVLNSGLKGEELVDFMKSLQQLPTGSSLISAILSQLSNPQSLKWCFKLEYGLALAHLLAGNSFAQVKALYIVQSHCFNLNFPKIEVKEKSRALIEILFQLLYQHDIIEAGAYITWADDDTESSGKVTAVIQTTPFLLFIREDDVQDEEEEDDDDDIDTPLQTVP